MAQDSDDWRTLLAILDERIVIESNVWPDPPVTSQRRRRGGVKLFKTSCKRLKKFVEREETVKKRRSDESSDDEREARLSEVATSLDPVSAMAAAAFGK